MDSDSEKSETTSIKFIFEKLVSESSEEPPIEEWSSLEINAEEYKPKKLLQEEYDPGNSDICDYYITLSASSVLKHPYYRYPAILDPGIENALLKPEKETIYSDDGQNLYMVICQQMKQCPVRWFHRGLLENDIDLRYYGVNPRNVRAMSKVLKYNKIVESIHFTDNFLDDDACYHLGDMLTINSTLTELDLSGCHIGPSGLLMLLTPMVTNRTLINLNLSNNELGDAGVEYLSDAVFKGLHVKIINLSRNNISGKGMIPLALAFETFNKFTHWNLSWNNLFSPGTYKFLVSLSETTKNLREIDLSWNSLSGPRVALGIKSILNSKVLEQLNLSYNKLEGEAISTIITNLRRATKLLSLNLSNNPMSAADAILVLRTLKRGNVKVSQILMDNVTVDKLFLNLIAELKQQKPHVIVTYGDVRGAYEIKGPDPRELVLNRAEYLCQKPKKNKVDIALILLQLQKDNVDKVPSKDFGSLLKRLGAPLNEDLVDEIANSFPGPRQGNVKTVDINLMVEYIRRKWPYRHLPPTPPPEPEPEPVKIKQKNKIKVKK